MSEPRTNVVGNIYLLHFNRPYLHAGHYLGWTEGPIEKRVARHLSGNGNPLVACVVRLGQEVTVARTWENVTREKERSLKNQGGANRHCPICNAEGKNSNKNWKQRKADEDFIKTVAWG